METLLGEKIDTLPEDVADQLWNGALRDELGLQSEDLQIALGIANMKQKAGDSATALRMYMALVLCEPGNFKFLQGLANAALRNGLFDAALEAGSAMVMVEPKNPFGYYFSGAACLALGHLAEAKADLVDAQEYAKAIRNAELFGECDKLLQQIEVQESA